MNQPSRAAQTEIIRRNLRPLIARYSDRPLRR
jgi:hypothetical protein